jgi:hypothetical protein
MSQLKVDTITNEAGTDSPEFPFGVDAAQLTGDIVAERMKDGFNASGDAPIYACRAWVNFDGTTTPPTIRASGNVSSVTRNGTGNYTVSFIEPMPDANYSLCHIIGGTSDGFVSCSTDALTIGSFTVTARSWNSGSGSNAAISNASRMSFSVMR